ncbi:MAG: hypothetical protein IJ087_21170 [Eggerthellaceae bacterium]|nr:hypothetical protein [Eggerthellaceae bacterium]
MSESEKTKAQEMGAQALSDETLDKLSGGYIFRNEEGEYAVIDGSGKEVAKFDEDWQAEQEAARRGLSTTEIEWDELSQMRGIKPYR